MNRYILIPDPQAVVSSLNPFWLVVVTLVFSFLVSHSQRDGEDWDQDQHHIGAAGAELGRSVFLNIMYSCVVGPSDSWVSPMFLYFQSWLESSSLAWTTSIGSVWRIPTRCWTRAQRCWTCGPAERASGLRVSTRLSTGLKKRAKGDKSILEKMKVPKNY